MSKIIQFLFKPSNAWSLAIFRVLFGICAFTEMIRINNNIIPKLFNSEFQFKWDFFEWIPLINPNLARFSIYFLFISCLLIIIGYFTRIALALHAFIYAYYILVDCSYYNNHYYLFLLINILLITTNCDIVFSIKSFFKNDKRDSIPNWQIFIFQFQIAIVYFIAGTVKINEDWLTCNTMKTVLQNSKDYKMLAKYISNDFLAFFLTYTGLFFDLSIGFFLLNKKTRHYAIIIIILFHIINIFNLNIGVFPYFSICAMILFVDTKSYLKLYLPSFIKNFNFNTKNKNSTEYSKFTFVLISIYCLLQILIPYRHFLIKGDTDWTGECNHYSWRMKVAIKFPTQFEIFTYNKYTKIEYKPSITFDQAQIQFLILNPKKLTQLAPVFQKKIGLSTIDSLDMKVNLSVILNGHPSTKLIDENINLANIKVNKLFHNSFITKEPIDYPK